MKDSNDATERKQTQHSNVGKLWVRSERGVMNSLTPLFNVSRHLEPVD